MDVFQGDADVWFCSKSFCVQDKSKWNKVRFLSWKPSSATTTLVHGGLWDSLIGGQSPKLMGEIGLWKALKRKVSNGCCLKYPGDKNNQINFTLLYSIGVFIHFAFLNGQWVAWHFSLTGTAYTEQLWILIVTWQQKLLYSLEYVNSSTGKLENSLYFT